MTRCRRLLFAFLAAGAAVSAVPAQEDAPGEAAPGGSPSVFGDESVPTTEEAAEDVLEALLEAALSAAERGEWESALELLNDAEELNASDPRIASYRQSFLELKAVDAAQDSWAAGEPAEVAGDGELPPDDETPKFTLDRGEKDRRYDPANFRDRFRAETAVKIVAVNPEESSGHNVWGSAEEFFYASLRTELRYWLPFLGKSLGFNFRNNGYSWLPGSPSILFSSLDLGVNVRGFLLESLTSRLEVGIDFGVSMNSLSTLGGSVDRRSALFLGLWISDPVIYHLFNLETFENLVLGMGLRIYSSASAELLERVVYRLDGAWQLEHWCFGTRFEWWDLGTLTEEKNLMSMSLFAGYRF